MWPAGTEFIGLYHFHEVQSVMDRSRLQKGSLLFACGLVTIP